MPISIIKSRFEREYGLFSISHIKLMDIKWYTIQCMEVIMAFSKIELVNLYNKRAQYYDFTANLYYLIGYREYYYRKKTIEALNLKEGDTVLEIACGTGLNFSLLHDAVGPSGKIIGLDVTDKMLEQAQKRIESKNWKNVELINADATQFKFPKGLNGVFSTFAITLIPEYEQVIKKGSESLVSGGRFAILDFKKPENRPIWIIKLLALAMRPFGVTLDLADRHPWEAIEKYFQINYFQEFYFGFSYLSVGEARKGS